VTRPLKIVVAGAGGRLGAALVEALEQVGHSVSAFARSQLDVTEAEQVAVTVRRLTPDVIVNCTAYNAVDAAESNPSVAFAVNSRGPAALADVARETGAVLVHYGTDFVFDGTASEPYPEEAPTNPLSVYGASKLAGEDEVRRIPSHYILRVESLFGGYLATSQRSTIDFLFDTLTAGGTVRALVDRTVSPSYVADVVRTTRVLIERQVPFGTYHCVTSGCTTWFDLANELACYAGCSGKVLPIEVDELNTAAPRPRFCALSNRKLLDLGINLRTWRAALYQHLDYRLSEVGGGTPARARIA
jgi:dTDP-4-dehydrorhamnose reductase